MPGGSHTESETGIDREPCGRCDGSGQIVKMVAGRSGTVECPACDNIPKFAVPDDPPEDPEARLEQIERSLAELDDEKEQLREARSRIEEATAILSDVTSLDAVDEETAVVLNHLRGQIRAATRETLDDRHIAHDRDRLRQEKETLQRYLDYRSESATSD